MTFECEYCNLILKTYSSLIKHKEINKKCISLQNKQENKEENIKKVFICEFCDKKFTAKQSKNNHLKTSYCKNIYEKELKNKEYEKQNNELQNQIEILQIQIKDKDDEINKLLTQIKDIENKHLKSELESMKDIVLKSVSAPKTINNNQHNNQQNNKYTFLTPFNLTKEEIKEKIDKNFTKDHFMNGQKGVADFTYNNLLLDENKQLNYFCSDTSRKFFCYKDVNGELKKDIKTKMLTNFIADDIIIKSNNICDNALLDKSLNLDTCHKYVIKKFDILNMKNDNNEFTATLSVLTCNPPQNTNNDETKVEDISSDVIFEIEDDEEENVYYTSEYFEDQEKKLKEMDKDSLYYKFFEKQLIEKKNKYFI